MTLSVDPRFARKNGETGMFAKAGRTCSVCVKRLRKLVGRQGGFSQGPFRKAASFSCAVGTAIIHFASECEQQVSGTHWQIRRSALCYTIWLAAPFPSQPIFSLSFPCPSRLHANRVAVWNPLGSPCAIRAASLPTPSRLHAPRPSIAAAEARAGRCALSSVLAGPLAHVSGVSALI